MSAKNSYLFVSYSRQDIDRILPLLKAVRKELARRAVPVALWADILDLSPGQQWDRAIEEALNLSMGALFFASHQSVNSSNIQDELSYVLGESRLVIPVLLEPNIKMPIRLRAIQYLDFFDPLTPEKTANTAKIIAEIVQSRVGASPPTVAVASPTDAPALAADIARQIRALSEPTQDGTHPTSVFLVHGHSSEALGQLEDYLSSVGVSAIVLSRQDESPQSLFQKFMSIAGKARFAIVLLGADDYGASCRQYDAPNVANLALQFRARQNVVLELGFFYGRLGWENVFVVYQEPGRVFPNFERPSDLDGVVFDSFSDAAWRKKLSAKLSAAGFKLDSSAVNG